MPMTSHAPLRIAISTFEFAHLPGARDLLRMIIRGLKLRGGHDLYLLVDADPPAEDETWATSLATATRKLLPVSERTRQTLGHAERAVRGRLRMLTRSGLRRTMIALLGADILDGLRVLPYRGGVAGIESACRSAGIDVVLPTTYSLKIPFVSYLYDCQHKHLPQNFSTNDIKLRDRFFARLIGESQVMLVNSQHAKQDLQNFFDARDSQVIALPFTPQLDPGSLSSKPELKGKYDLPGRFFLISNQFWIHKSHETALQALRLLVDEGLDDCHIVFTGEMNDTRFPDYVPRFMSQVDEMGLRRHTTFLGYIPKRDQLEIMRSAVAVLQTTLFEGGPGGGAIYDAVAMGVRAIVSGIPINHELPTGPTLELFEPANARDLADRMRNFWRDAYRRPEDAELVARAEDALKIYSDRLYEAVERAQTCPHTQSAPARGVRISVITVVKNAAHELPETLQSVFGQGYQNFEYIVVDGGSDDGTIDIVKSYGDAIKYVCEPDEGIYDAMNKGIAIASGDVLYFLNAGDTLYDPHVFTDVVSVIGDPAYREYGLFYGNVQFIRPDGTLGRHLEYNPFPFYYYADNCQCHQVCFYRREMFERYGSYDKSFRVYGDQEFNARLVVGHDVPSFYMGRLIVRYKEGGFSEEMLISGASACEKKRIQRRYFGDTPDWFFERLKQGH